MLQKIFLILSIITCFTLLIQKCNDYDPFDPVISGDFTYTDENCKEGHRRIIGLSEEGKTKEVLVFPSLIDGYIVDGLGATFALGKPSGEITINNAKKIYLPAGYVMQTPLDFKLNKNEEINVYIIEEIFIDVFTYNYPDYIGWNNLFVTDTVYEKVKSKYDIDLMKMRKANVVYYVDNKEYFVDDCDGTTVNVIPPTPYKEGYEFNGWYKDKECINEWNFESDLVDKKEYDEQGNYIFKKTRIYAKWIELKDKDIK